MFFFTPLRGFYFTFPSLYFFTIGHSGVFSLTRWSSQIHTGFHVPHATRDFLKFRNGLTTGLSPSMVQDSAASSLPRFYLLVAIAKLSQPSTTSLCKAAIFDCSPALVDIRLQAATRSFAMLGSDSKAIAPAPW